MQQTRQQKHQQRTPRTNIAVTASEETKTEEPDPTADEEEDEDTEQTGHAPVFTISDLHPVATRSVPRVLDEVSKPQQRAQAEELYTFLHSPTPILARLNKSNKCYVGVVNIPKIKFMRVVYAFGFGTNPIGAMASPTD